MRTQETIRTLNKLIKTCRDGEELCRACGDTADSPGLRTLLRYRSEEWGRQGDELQALVLLLGGEPAVSATPAAKMLRMWLTAKMAIVGPSDPSILEVWQRAQHRALDHYEEALSGYLPERIRRTVSLQADRIMDRFEQIGGLREQYSIHSQGASHV